MVRTTSLLVILAGLTACFDPTLPPECKGAVCGEIQDPPEGGGGTTGANAGGGGMAMSAGGGGAGGAAGGAGGIGGIGGGGGGPLTITIMNPVNGGTYPHGQALDFIAEVSGGTPANDQIRWQLSTIPGIFGVGYVHTRSIDFIDSHTLTAAVMEGDTPIATDSITIDTN